MMGLGPLEEETRELLASPYEDTARRQLSENQKEGPIQMSHLLAP